jgi:DNA mismatch repair protein MutL
MGRGTGQGKQYKFYDDRAGIDKKSLTLFSSDDLGEIDFRVLGQFYHSYIIVEKKGELLIVDQHNAHERINFERLKKEYQENKVSSISPLFPVILELSPSEVQRMDDTKLKLLEKLGFELSPLSSNSFDIKKFPQILEERQIKDAIRTVIHLKDEEANLEDAVISEVACKSSIKVNHKMIPEEMVKLVRDLFNTANPYFCPHKRPIVLKFSLEEIEKMMKRK